MPWPSRLGDVPLPDSITAFGRVNVGQVWKGSPEPVNVGYVGEKGQYLRETIFSGCPKPFYIFRTSGESTMSEIMLHISDMGVEISPLKSQVLERIAKGAKNAVWTPSDFLDLANRDAVDKTLQRLVKAGDLRRIDRGLYDRPGINSLTKEQSAPDPRAIVEAVARRDQIRVLVDGMTAANDLGLTNAVPAKIVVHSEARPKSIKLGNLTIDFKQTAASKLYWAGRPAMRIVQALHWLRDTMPGDDIADWQDRLTSLLADPLHGEKLRADLTDGFATLPAWMQDFLRPLLRDRASFS